MAIIIEHVETQTLYVLVGSGYALGPRSKDDAYPLVACADGDGKIRWFYSNQLSVELVDGRRPDDLLLEAEGVVYERTDTTRPAARAPAPDVSRPAAATATTTVEEPPVDPKEVVGTSADLWNDPRPL